jgi:hypothetical protein
MAITRVSQLTAATVAADDFALVSKRSATVFRTATTISAQASDNSFNDSANGFLTAGFALGNAVNVAGFTGNVANNIVSGIITALTAGKMTIGGTDGDVIVDDAAGESVTISKWESRRVTASSLAGLASGLGGSTGATDNALLRANGTGGATVQATGITVGDADEISGYLANRNLQTGATYTIDVAGADTDSGKIIDHANAAGIAVTLPNSAPAGFACTYVQAGAGQITFAVEGGGTAVLRNRQSHAKTAGQWAMVTLYVRGNSGGTAAEWVLGGDTAAWVL